MKKENTQKNRKRENAQEDESVPAKDSPNKYVSSELDEPVWSVINFEGVVKAKLKYDEAVQKMQELAEQKVSGLCIVTDKAAQGLAE